MQRAALDALQDAPDCRLGMSELASAVFGTGEPSESQRASLRRAVRGLVHSELAWDTLTGRGGKTYERRYGKPWRAYWDPGDPADADDAPRLILESEHMDWRSVTTDKIEARGRRYADVMGDSAAGWYTFRNKPQTAQAWEKGIALNLHAIRDPAKREQVREAREAKQRERREIIAQLRALSASASMGAR